MPLKTLEAIPQVILSSCPQTMSFVRCVGDQFDRVAIKVCLLAIGPNYSQYRAFIVRTRGNYRDPGLIKKTQNKHSMCIYFHAQHGGITANDGNILYH